MSSSILLFLTGCLWLISSFSYCYNILYLSSLSAVSCFQQWINDVDSSSLSLLFHPLSPPKKPVPLHSSSYPRSPPGFIRKFQAGWNVRFTGAMARVCSLSLVSYVRGEIDS
jgi:hypothetical protein